MSANVVRISSGGNIKRGLREVMGVVLWHIVAQEFVENKDIERLFNLSGN
jgi:hypothetical protein